MGLLDLLTGTHREPAECVIKVDGEEIAGLYPYLSEVTVDTSRAEAAAATLRFESRRLEDGTWSVQDQDILAPWKSVVIEAAFGDATEEVMRGRIREVSADYPEDASTTTVSVRCQDDSIALSREHVRTVWGGDAPTDDATILTTILAKYGLAPHPDNASGRAGLVLNQDDTDIGFLMSRAEANGYELIFREEQVYFGPMRVETEPQATVMVYAGPDTNCTRFSVRSEGDHADAVTFDAAAPEGSEGESATVRSDLPLMGTDALTSEGAGLADHTWRMVRQGGADREALTAQAQRKANELAMKVIGEGELEGSLYGHVLRVAEPVAIDGVGRWLSGTYYVDTVKHVFSMDGYRQSFTVLRNAYGDNLESGSGVLSAIL